MRFLLDTNIVLRLNDTAHVHHTQARAALDWIDASGHESVVVPQVIYEFWVVATRPVENNGLGLTTLQVSQTISASASIFNLLRDERGIYDWWQELVSRYDVKGKNAHDVRLVAAMNRHQIQHILTFNLPDFTRFSGIVAFSPSDVLNDVIPVGLA